MGTTNTITTNKKFRNEWPKKMRKMVEYKIMERVPGEKNSYRYTGEFVDHCNKFKKETPYTNHEVQYLELHQEEIRTDYARDAILEYLNDCLKNVRLGDKFWDDSELMTDTISSHVGSSRLLREDEELEQERAR